MAVVASTLKIPGLMGGGGAGGNIASSLLGTATGAAVGAGVGIGVRGVLGVGPRAVSRGASMSMSATTSNSYRNGST
jgi:hypothetical protein